MHGIILENKEEKSSLIVPKESLFNMLQNLELSVVLPCLNEEESIAFCIKKIQKAFLDKKINGEIIVVDNGSTDKSVEISKSLGATVIFEEQKGYGSALRRGIEESSGKYIVMGDADDTYDYLEIPKFLELLRNGYDLVMGSRSKGKMMPGAMTWSHRYIGNPILSGMLRIFFGGSVSDSHCGLRAFSKEAYKKMNLHTTGMEFASEMVIHSLKKKLKIAEVPIIYHPRKGESKLSSFSDAWRHIRFMLLYSPNYLFLLPGSILFILSFIMTMRFLFGPIWFAGRNWDIHVMVFTAISTLIGWQIFTLGFSAKLHAHQIGLEESSFTKRFVEIFTLEKALLLGLIFFLIGIGCSLYIILAWLPARGELCQVKTGIFAILMLAIGLQTTFSAFLMSMLQIKYR